MLLPAMFLLRSRLADIEGFHLLVVIDGVPACINVVYNMNVLVPLSEIYNHLR